MISLKVHTNARTDKRPGRAITGGSHHCIARTIAGECTDNRRSSRKWAKRVGFTRRRCSPRLCPTLTDVSSLSKHLLHRGPVVVSFYRGGRCPFCNLELRGLQRALPEIVQVGASLVAISPQLPDNSLSTEEKNQLTFPVLSDVGNIVAKRFGIVFTLPPALVHANKAIGRDLVEINGEAGVAQLPMPATFVLDKSGVIRLAFVEEDWSKRLDPDIIGNTLRGLGK